MSRMRAVTSITSRTTVRSSGTKDVYQTELDNGVEGYSETMLAIVANFKNAGKPEGFNVQSMVGKSKRGEVALRLFAVVDDSVADPVFVKVGFKSRGCLAMTGCASAICSMIEGKTFSQALELTPKDVELAVDGVPKGKGHTTLFAIEAVRGLVGDWMYRCGMPLAGDGREAALRRDVGGVLDVRALQPARYARRDEG